MKTTTFKITEIFLLISLPVSLLVACNGDIDKKDNKVKSQVSEAKPEFTPNKTDIAAFEDNTLKIKSVSSALHQSMAETKAVAAPQTNQDLEIVKVPTKRVINFSSNRFKLTAAQRKLIKQHAQYLRYNPNSTLMISGFSDAEGPADLNYELSKRRANSVYAEFKKLGIVDEQLDVRAYGEAFALQTAVSGYDDRRVELDYIQRNMPTTAMLGQ